MQHWEEKYYDREAGRKEGIKEGIKEGRFSALLESVRSLMESMGLTADEAMDVLQITDVAREALRERVADDTKGNGN